MNMVSNTDIVQLKVTSVPKINITDNEKDCISIHMLHGENDYDLNVTKYKLRYDEMYEQYDKIINGNKYA